MEGWKQPAKKVSSATVEVLTAEEVSVVEEDGIELSSRRMEAKRKGEEAKCRKAKRRRLPRLEGWGETDDSSHKESLDDWIVEPERMEQKEVVEERIEQAMTDDRLDKETCSMLQKPSKVQERKLTISEGVRKKKFVFYTRGKLTKKEVVELRRTNNNIFDWVAKEKNKVMEKDNFEERMQDV